MENVKITKAIEFATKKHKGQTRESNDNEPYINHVMRVYNTIIQYGYGVDENVAIAAILHDTVEDTNTSYEEICNEFGSIVMNYVLLLTNTVSSRQVGRHAYHEVNFHRIVNAPRQVQAIKIADMMDNLSDVATTFDKKFAEKYLDEKVSIVEAISSKWYNQPMYIDLKNIIREQYKLLKK